MNLILSMKVAKYEYAEAIMVRSTKPLAPNEA